MARIIAVDPGTRLCGYAVFVDGEPVVAGVVRSKADTVAQRAGAMAADVLDALPTCAQRLFDVAVVERPVIYPDSRERDSDIVDLAVSAGVIGGLLSGNAYALVMPTPREWKGAVPKHIHNERTKAKCPAAVSLVERDVPKGQQNHVWDAVGLALWYLNNYHSKGRR